MSLASLLPRLVLPLVLSGLASAQGLVQLTLRGALEVEGGARVQLAVRATTADGVQRAALDLFLAEGTDAGVVAALLAARAQEAGIGVLLPPAVATRDGAPAGATLFFERAVAIEQRLPSGLHSQVVLCHDAPRQLVLLPPQAAPGPARIRIAASTVHPHTERLGRASLIADLPADGSGARAGEELFKKTAAADWVAERPSPEAWRAVRLADGSLIRGLSVELRSPGTDWGFVLELEPGRQ